MLSLNRVESSICDAGLLSIEQLVATARKPNKQKTAHLFLFIPNPFKMNKFSIIELVCAKDRELYVGGKGENFIHTEMKLWDNLGLLAPIFFQHYLYLPYITIQLNMQKKIIH